MLGCKFANNINKLQMSFFLQPDWLFWCAYTVPHMSLHTSLDAQLTWRASGGTGSAPILMLACFPPVLCIAGVLLKGFKKKKVKFPLISPQYFGKHRPENNKKCIIVLENNKMWTFRHFSPLISLEGDGSQEKLMSSPQYKHDRKLA